MYYRDVGLRFQDRLDVERFSPVSMPVAEFVETQQEKDAFQMRGLFGEIPGSSCEPIRIARWTTSD
ncbi:MAG TPA: hypothetical protein VL282_14090 [Tepidisphaeraceae bacterium]|nr:hypothetical protein [Tepidisphaeraceae bacterium]